MWTKISNPKTRTIGSITISEKAIDHKGILAEEYLFPCECKYGVVRGIQVIWSKTCKDKDHELKKSEQFHFRERMREYNGK